MSLYIIVLVVNLIMCCGSKKYLLKTDQQLVNRTLEKKDDNNYDDPMSEANHNDYMVDIEIQSVDVGQPVELKCTSPKEFSACFFSKPGGNIFYKIQPNVKFEKDRLHCLCDVSPSPEVYKYNTSNWSMDKP